MITTTIMAINRGEKPVPPLAVAVWTGFTVGIVQGVSVGRTPADVEIVGAADAEGFGVVGGCVVP
jgi:hypothetical protein